VEKEGGLVLVLLDGYVPVLPGVGDLPVSHEVV